jgi:tripeptide aminopeptidase
MRAYERFLKYVSIDTTSDESFASCPSTPNQKVLGQMLVDEMKAMGIAGSRMDEHGYVYGFIPAKGDTKKPTVGFIAHMDTSNAVPGGPIKPAILPYQGGDITLANGLVISENEFDFLKELCGKSLIVTDGNTLLGADDKAGVAEILTMCEKLFAPGAPDHGKVCIAFTPDEEIGQGADLFDVKGFGADYAYTVDGGTLGEIEYENFNAASAKIDIHGVNIHPGSAKNKMRNAILLAMEFNAMLPPQEIPACTEGYEGFQHLNSIHGEEELTTLHYIIRDHDMDKFRLKKARFEKIASYLNEKYGAGTVELSLKDSYFNMREQLTDHMYIIEKAKNAMESLGVKPIIQPIRGGTDGARLSFMGLPCPNLSTGGYNFHGRRELIPIESMDTMAEVLLTLVKTA